MDFTLMPSLEHRALIKIVVTLWNHDDIRALIARFFPRSQFFSERRKEWQVIEDKVIEKISHLPLLELLKKEVLNFIKPIGLEMFKWREYHEQNYYLDIDLPNELCWTPQGTIDKKKTAEVLIKDENLDIARRYKIACIYCLENDIPQLWNKMPKICRKSFYSKENPSKVRQKELVILWTYDIKGEVAKMDNMIERIFKPKCSPYHNAFKNAALGGNKSAIEYFLQKLTPMEREESLITSTEDVARKHYDTIRNRTDLPKGYYADVLCFLLSQMDEEQQIEVFKSCHYEVLSCFLDWPWQSFFMGTANRIWNFLPEYQYNLLLRMIVNKVIDGYKDCNYQKIFGEFWQKSKDAHKKYVIAECASEGFLLPKLFRIKDEKNISLILKDAPQTDKEKIIFTRKGKNICKDLVYSNDWNFLKFFIGECIDSQETMIKFKEEFQARITWCCSREELSRNKDKWDKFFQLLDEFICGYYKSAEEGDSSPARSKSN